MRDGLSDCFSSKEARDSFFNKLVEKAKTTQIPSDTEICKGESPYGIEGVPYPYCVNHRWEIEEGLKDSLSSKISHEWDNWNVKNRRDLPSSEDFYAGPDRVEEFNDQFLFIACVKVPKLKEVI